MGLSGYIAISDTLRKLLGRRSTSALPSPQGTQIGGRIAYPDKAGYIANSEHGFNKNPVVAACVGLYASTLNEPPLGLLRQDGTVDTNHPLSLLFRRPNKYMGQAEFWQIVWTYLAIGGNCYIKKVRSVVGNVVELIPYSDAFVVPVLDRLGWVEQYQYISNDVREIWQRDDVIHIINPAYRDPLRMYMGKSPIEVAWDKINTYNELQATMYSLVASNAVPSGILTAQGDIPPSTVASLKVQLKKRLNAQGVERTEPLVLGSGMTYQQMGLDATRLQATELLQELEVAICGAFRIHPVVALTSAGLARSTYNNIQAAYNEYTTLTRVPFWNALEEQLESGFQKEYPGIQLQFDTTNVQALQPDADAMIYPVVATFNANVITVNETRAKLGYEPMEDGDKFQYQVVPAADFGFMSMPTATNESSAKKQQDAVIETVVQQGDNKRIKWVEAEATKYYQAQNAITDEYAAATTVHVKAFIDAALQQAKSSVKAYKAKKPQIQVDELVRRFMVANEKQQAKLFKQILDLAIATTDGTLSDVQSYIDDLQNEQAKAIISRMTDSGKTLQRELDALYESNPAASSSEMSELIQERFTTISASRSETIARTIGKAQTSVVQNHTMRNLNTRISDTNERFVNVWLSQRDNDVRETHEELDGQWVEIGGTFDKFVLGVGEGPALGSDPSEVINCRCTLRPVRKSKLS